MARNCLKWLEMAVIGWKWLEIAGMAGKAGMAKNG